MLFPKLHAYSCTELQVHFKPLFPVGVSDYCQHDRRDRVPPGGVCSLCQPDGEHGDVTARQGAADPPAGDFGHGLVPQLCHHHDTEFSL